MDDEPTLRLGFAYALSSRTTMVETAATGRIALDRIAATTFDVMILDLRMPDLDGIGVIEALRSNGDMMPIILCSAALHPSAALRAIRRGVVDFLLKPVRPVDLRQVIDFVIRPENRPLPQAMKAARSGNYAEAILLLENQDSPSRQAAHWLSLLKSIRDADTADDTFHLEKSVGINLSILAFNSPTAG
ncbi:MAG: response regulator [Luteolibacter sp.]|uniref:response regulator n=1 Tax=Luteolibacter sp. TaxID=1962973 RepID=UPI0032679A7A